MNPVLRFRHAYLKLETPVVDILIGQTWNLFGWQANYLVTSVQEPGLPGQMFQRTPQLRISKTIKRGDTSVELGGRRGAPATDGLGYARGRGGHPPAARPADGPAHAVHELVGDPARVDRRLGGYPEVPDRRVLGHPRSATPGSAAASRSTRTCRSWPRPRSTRITRCR